MIDGVIKAMDQVKTGWIHQNFDEILTENYYKLVLLNLIIGLYSLKVAGSDFLKFVPILNFVTNYLKNNFPSQSRYFHPLLEYDRKITGCR